LNVKTESLLTTTESPADVSRRVTESDDNDDSEESFDEEPTSEPEVVFSRDAHGTMTTGLHGRKQTPAKRIAGAESAENAEEPKILALLSHLDENPTGTGAPRTINEKRRSNAKDSALPVRSENFPESDISASTPVQSTMNLDATDDYANLPDYVRFPSSEANSIHSQSYKQHSFYPSNDFGSYGGDSGSSSSSSSSSSITSTKSSVPVRQKPVYYLEAAPSWKPDRPESDRVPTTSSERQKQSPMLLRFWSKMPLVRDPAIYPVDRIPDGEAIDDDIRKQRRDRFLRTFSSRTTDLLPMAESTPWLHRETTFAGTRDADRRATRSLLP